MSVLRTRKEVVTADEVGSWLSCAEDHVKTTAIELSGKHLEDDTVLLIGALAMQCTCLRSLELGGNAITDAGADFLARHLAEAPCVLQGRVLSHLDLRSNRITARGAEAISRVFLLGGCGSQAAAATNTVGAQTAAEEACERILDLSQNTLGDQGVQAVAQCLGRNNDQGRRLGAVRLRLRGVGCGDKGLKAVLSFKETLAELDVAANPIGVVGVESVCRAVCGGAPWHTLSLASLLPEVSQSSNTKTATPKDPIGSEIKEPLAKCVGHLHGLRMFDVGGNNLGDTGCQKLVEALARDEENFCLKHLALDDNGCHDNGSKALRSALLLGSGGSGGLRLLRLDGNRLDDGCVQRLAEGIERSNSLTELSLARNQIMCKGAAALAQALCAQRRWAAATLGDGDPGCLVVLNISGNPLCDEGAEALAKAAAAAAEDPASRTFQAPWGLEKLVLEETRVQTRGRSALCMAIAARAALVDAAVNGFVGEEGTALLRSVQSRKVRLPNGLHVYGHTLDDREAVVMRDSAHARLRDLWPSGHDNKGSSAEEVANAWGCSKVVLQDYEIDEAYFEVELAPDDSRITPLGDYAAPYRNAAPLLPVATVAQGDPLAASSQEAPPSPKKEESAAKGKGKAPGKGKAASPPKKGGPPEKGKGKGPAPKAPGKGGLPKAKAESQTQAARRKSLSDLAETPFGRRIHLVQPIYDEPDSETVFGELFFEEEKSKKRAQTMLPPEEEGTEPAQEQKDAGDEMTSASSMPMDVDTKLLVTMLGGNGDADKAKDRKRRTTVKAPTGMTVLNPNRAQNMAIVLSKLTISSQDLCDCLRDLDFSDPRLTTENIELLMTVMPTPEESQKLLEHRDNIERLRDIEQKVMPFCMLARCMPRLKLMRIFLSHKKEYNTLHQRCKVLSSAAEEMRKSKSLKKVLGIILRICNFINHGTKELTARGFAIESLPSLASFKMGSVSTMHFLCLTMRASDACFLEVLKEGLKHIHLASREKSLTLKAAVEAFNQEVAFAQRELEHLDDDAAAKERMKALLEELESESEELGKELEKAFRVSSDVQRYFSVSDKKGQAPPPCEQFFGHFASFLGELETAWLEIERNPAAWKKFMSAGLKNEVNTAKEKPKLERSRTWAVKSASDQQGRQIRTCPDLLSAAADAGTKPPLVADEEASGQKFPGLRRYRTTQLCKTEESLSSTASGDSMANPPRERAHTADGPNLLKVPETPAIGRRAPSEGAPSCSASQAGSDVAFMLDVDDLIDSIFCLCNEDADDSKTSTAPASPAVSVPASPAFPSRLPAGLCKEVDEASPGEESTVVSPTMCMNLTTPEGQKMPLDALGVSPSGAIKDATEPQAGNSARESESTRGSLHAEDLLTALDGLGL